MIGADFGGQETAHSKDRCRFLGAEEKGILYLVREFLHLTGALIMEHFLELIALLRHSELIYHSPNGLEHFLQ